MTIAKVFRRREDNEKLFDEVDVHGQKVPEGVALTLGPLSEYFPEAKRLKITVEALTD